MCTRRERTVPSFGKRASPGAASQVAYGEDDDNLVVQGSPVKVSKDAAEVVPGRTGIEIKTRNKLKIGIIRVDLFTLLYSATKNYPFLQRLETSGPEPTATKEFNYKIKFILYKKNPDLSASY